MTFLIMLSVILLSMLMILIKPSDLLQQLESASELESDLRDTVACGLLISMLKKLNWFCLTRLLTLVILM